ncbi:DUF4270 family protein [Tenacibaculum caenipelagi]|uniref:Uncharacterized protein DUF4270 n=1 Tax=Tenacibaculum caenipelagi TaxID=1325435 RepID=A0A4R6TH00_9FLAO|nr:DUF4270 family protein [Tenacibaculum caenipelagi]TDQ28480.1 uncharacterized protein DUF4270 [Tenacibaculum caenipelagi]
MIRKIGVLGISLLCFTAIISCEKDFSEVGTNVVNNTKFETGEILLDVEITPINIESVQADNINTTISDYWLGVYKNTNAEKIEASIISQIGYISGFKNTAGTDTILNLDKVILRLPYPATSTGKNSDGITEYKLDSILGNTSIGTSVTVKQNNTYLNRLNPSDPSKKNTFFSDFDYEEVQVLNEDLNFTFKPNKIDTLFSYERIDRFNPSEKYDEIIKTTKIVSSDTIPVPFLAIPLDVAKMKSLFWDKFEGAEFASKEEFDNYFRGLIIEASGDDGALVPFNLASSPSPSLDFYYTKSVMEGGSVKDTLNRKYSFPLSGIKNSHYKMTTTTSPAPANNFVIQGTAGSMAEVKILDDTKLLELRSNNWLINDASLTFYINQTISTEANLLPQQLFLYQNKENDSAPTQLSDAYMESATFGGNLALNDNDAPEKYTFRITDYISNLLAGEEDFTADPLILKVHNPTDIPVSNNILTTSVKTYNWNPRAVTLLDGNETVNGTKRAVLKISYSKEK